jgi:hypothetical protein
MTDTTEASRAVPVPEPSPRDLIDAQVRQTVTERGVTNFPRGDILVAWAILQLADAIRAKSAPLVP